MQSELKDQIEESEYRLRCNGLEYVRNSLLEIRAEHLSLVDEFDIDYARDWRLISPLTIRGNARSLSGTIGVVGYRHSWSNFVPFVITPISASLQSRLAQLVIDNPIPKDWVESNVEVYDAELERMPGVWGWDDWTLRLYVSERILSIYRQL